MNVGIVLILLAVVIFALRAGLIWIAFAAAAAMLLFATDSMKSAAENSVQGTFPGSKQYLRPSNEDYTKFGEKNQTLKIMNWPRWDGDEFWEVGIKTHGDALGKWFGLSR